MPQILFRFDCAASVDGWSAIDDRVMGGVSRSRLRHDAAGHAVFEGHVSLDRNGGFASIRSLTRSLGLAGAVDCVIEVCGDGRRFKLNLRTDAAFDGVNYQASFAPVAGRWSVIRLPLSAFRPTFRGRDVPGALPLDPDRIEQLGFMIADQQAGDFALAIRSIWLE